MSDVSGPVKTLPGALKHVPHGKMCDEHPTILATHRVQGETDSMGCEWLDMCDECYKEYCEGIAELDKEEQYCEWCSKQCLGVAPFRDPDEGMAGPVYDVCPDCRACVMERANDDMDSLGDDSDVYEPDDDDEDNPCPFDDDREPDEIDEVEDEV